MTSIPFTQARAHLADLIDQSKQGKKVFISQRGQTTAVLMSIPEYQKLVGKPSDIAESLSTWREKFKDELSDADEDFIVKHDQSKGRDFSW